MEKQLLFVEDGSLSLNTLNKLAKEHGLKDQNIIWYEKGAAKPELVSFDTTQNSEVYKQEAKEEILNSLYKFLIDRTERTSNMDNNRWSTQYGICYKTTYRGTIDELMDEFKQLLDNQRTE